MYPMPGAVRPWTGDNKFVKSPTIMPPYHVLPMFQHLPVPLVDMELFRPVPERRQLPNILNNLLIPEVDHQRIQVSPMRNTRGVEVWCGYRKVSVRLNKRLLGFRGLPSSFHLGTCSVSRTDKKHLYFHYDLNECGGSLKMMNGQIVYSNIVLYTPEPQGIVIRAVPLALNIQCSYNRFHYSYKIGFLPVVKEPMFHKTFESRVKFSLFVCNEHWEKLGENGRFVLGEPMYFEASAAHTSKDEMLFIDSCYVTASNAPSSTSRHHVIRNFGCMEDSRRQGSLSRFLLRQSNILRFSVDAFLLPQVTDMNYYLHCTVSVHNVTTSATAKSCTYNKAERRWEEIYTDASVCACCDSTCDVEYTPSLTHVMQSLITSEPWILDQNEQPFILTKKGLVNVQEGTNVVHRISEEEQMETKEIRDYINEEVEIIAGKETTNKVAYRSGKVIFLKEKVEMEEGDAGRFKNQIKTDFVEKSEAQLLKASVEDVNHDKRSNKIQPKQMNRTSREEMPKKKMQPEHFEKNLHLQRAIQPRMLIDEDMFLNAKQEPIEWNEDID
ncbi:zona pellucida glycoprotein 3d tandem duplicate 1 [Xyrauchen texanus]|uniref:zona pellucida glycoprotein 3d tandem duplicate 1 n=1 Tax=Xyrauchen texanus TaxID=154827 RepID=UPI0022422373|nr:zona pellucida glycoprotein 3d tandem duplicate 1 [Xyrauchen texanus]